MKKKVLMVLNCLLFLTGFLGSQSTFAEDLSLDDDLKTELNILNEDLKANLTQLAHDYNVEEYVISNQVTKSLKGWKPPSFPRPPFPPINKKIKFCGRDVTVSILVAATCGSFASGAAVACASGTLTPSCTAFIAAAAITCRVGKNKIEDAVESCSQ